LRQKDNNTNCNRNFVIRGGLNFLILLLFNANFYAQKFVERSIISNASNLIFEFDIIDQIVINESQSSNKITVSAESAEDYPLNIVLEEKNGKVFIKNVEDNFDVNDEKIDKICNIQPIYTSFKIMIPKGKNVFISYVDGNLYLNEFDGKLKIILNDGIVNLNHFRGSVYVKMNGGNFYCSETQDVEIDVRSNLGIISSNLLLHYSINNKNHVKGVYGQNVNELIVQSISANIHLN
jgi:hypothetical protein